LCGLKEKEDRLPIHACCCRCVRKKKGGRGSVLMFEEGEGESGGCQEPRVAAVVKKRKEKLLLFEEGKGVVNCYCCR
jgi:hypothetical protein